MASPLDLQEQEQLDQIKSFWNHYGNLITWTVTLALAGFAGIDLSRRLGNPSGGLPFTVVYGGDGKVLQRHVGETNDEQLAAWAKG